LGGPGRLDQSRPAEESIAAFDDLINPTLSTA